VNPPELLPAERESPATNDEPDSRSWLQDTLKRKLVDFAWNWRFFYLAARASLCSGHPATSFNQAHFFNPGRLF